MKVISVEGEYRQALVLCFERFAARGRALRLNQATDSGNLGGTTLPAAGELQLDEKEHIYYNPMTIAQPDDLPDEAEELPSDYSIKSEGSSESDA